MNLISPSRLSAAAMGTDTMDISEQLLQGSQIQEYLEQIARLRLTVFREYPYLYDGKLKDELEYLKHYANHVEATVIIASCGNEVVGAVTAIPLQYESEELSSPFAATQYPVERIIYIGEMLFYAGYRNKGLGSRLLSSIEQHFVTQKNYEYLTSATVMRADDDPYCPDGYVPIDRFLQRNQFAQLPGVTTHFTWKEVDGIPRDHEMQFWIKALCPMSWQLWRQDDNGQRFLVGEYKDEATAETSMADLMKCLHKQTYWIEKAIE